MVQGNFLAICSDPETISRNSGIVWAMLQVLVIAFFLAIKRGNLVWTGNYAPGSSFNFFCNQERELWVILVWTKGGNCKLIWSTKRRNSGIVWVMPILPFLRIWENYFFGNRYQCWCNLYARHWQWARETDVLLLFRQNLRFYFRCPGWLAISLHSSCSTDR